MIKEISPTSRKHTSVIDDNRLRTSVLFATGAVLLTNLSLLLFGLTRTDMGKTVVITVTVIIFVAFTLALRGNLLPARIITPLSVFLGMTYFLASGIGVRHPAIIGFPVIIVLAGLLLGQNGAAIFSVLTTVAIASVGYAELKGLFTVDYSTFFDTLPLDANIFWILNLTSGVIIFSTIRLLTQTADEAKSSTEAEIEANRELRILQKDLEKRVAERTQDLEYKASQLATIAQVAHDALIFQNVSELLANLAILISEKFGYYHTGIFLLDDKGEYATLQAASSDGGKKMLERGHQLQVGGEGIVGSTAAEKRPHIALDVGTDAVYFNNPDLPETHSEIALPLLVQNNVLGVLDIQSKGTQAFHQQDIEIFQTLANQLALAIQNARLLEKSQESIAQLEMLTDAQTQTAWEAHLEHQSHRFLYTPLGVKRLRRDGGFNEEEGDERANIPITLRGKAIGKIALNRPSKQWSNKEKALISDVAEQVGLAIENTRLVDETRDQANRDQLVSEFSSKLRETLDMDTVIKTAIEEMKKTFNLDGVEMRLSTPDKDKTED